MTVSGVIGEFGIRALIGLGAVLPLVPVEEVDPWYFRTQALVALGCAVLLGLAGGGWLPWLAAFLSWSAFVFWTLGRTSWGRLCFALLAGCGLAQLVATRLISSGMGLLIGVDYVLSSVFVAAVYSAMILGHWYLVWPWMSIWPLKRTISLAAAALLARGLWWALLAVPHGLIDSAIQDLQARYLMLAQVGVGFLGVSVGLFLAYKCTQIRSTQSATGILYAATVMALLGELAGGRLIDRSTGPVGQVGDLSGRTGWTGPGIRPQGTIGPMVRRITDPVALDDQQCPIRPNPTGATARPTRVRRVAAVPRFPNRLTGAHAVQVAAGWRVGRPMPSTGNGSTSARCVVAATCTSRRTFPTPGGWRSCWSAFWSARCSGSITTTFMPWRFS